MKLQISLIQRLRQSFLTLFLFSALFTVHATTFDADKPMIVFNSEYVQSFETNTWDDNAFYNQWITVGDRCFSASDITNGYLQFVWVPKRFMISKSAYSKPYIVKSKISYGNSSNRGGLVIRLSELSDNIQEPPADPGFNRMGVAFYPADANNYCVQFSGIENNRTNTPQKKILIPKPTNISDLMSGAHTLQVEDFGEIIYVYIDNVPFFRIDFGVRSAGVYTSGTVYNAEMTQIDTFTGMLIPALGKVAVAQRDAELRLHEISIKTLTKDITFDKLTPTLTPLYQVDCSQAFNQANFDANWDVISSFSSTNTTSSYWKMGWINPRVLRTKSNFNIPYVYEVDYSLATGTVRGGVIIRAPKNGSAEDLQETGQNVVVPMFNRAGIALFANADGSQMYVQFSGVVNGYTTPYIRISVPAPVGENLRNRALLKIEDYGNSIYVFYNSKSLCRIDFDQTSTENNASGVVYNGSMVIQGYFENMVVPVTDFKLAIAARDDVSSTDDLRIYSIKISSATMLPEPPFNVTAKAGDSKATVSFSKSENLAIPVSKYVVKSYPGNIIIDGTSSPITILGLTNGVEYTFTVTAVNSMGSSAESVASAGVTPTKAILQLSSNQNQWTGTDALGRKLSDGLTLDTPKKNKYVGIFYWTWHTDNIADYSPVMNITEIRKQYPEAMSDFNHPAWNNKPEGGVFWWDEPLFGYYRTTDEWVLRRHAEMLADAGVDVVFFDCTNGSQTWKTSYTKLLETWSKAREEGVKTPQVAFMLPFGATDDAALSMSELYTDLYEPGLYKDLWFMWKDKPLIMAYPEIKAQAGNTAGMKFTSSSTFNAVNVTCPSWTNSIGNLTLKLYNWNTNYNTSISGSPIASKTFENYDDNSKLTLNFDAQVQGDYVWELSGASEVVGVWKWTESNSSSVQSYFDGKSVSGNYESEIFYVQNNSYTALATGTNHIPLQLLVSVPQSRVTAMQSFFTFRPGQADMVNGPTRNDHWGWLEVAPQHAYIPKPDGGYEQATVGVAQNASDASGGHASAFNSELTYGRSYTHMNGHDKSEDAYLKGLNFQEQWNNAFAIDPDLIFVTGWNEWIGGRWLSWDVKPFSFVDTYSAEKSRDTEPVKSWGNKGDVYYLQLIENIRKFKGIDAIDSTSNLKTIDISRLSDWNDVYPSYVSHKGNTIHRNHKGAGNTLIYQNITGRNDIVSAKVARDAQYIYFYVETDEALSPKTDNGWMRLFIDIDRNKNTGWEGYNFVLNRTSPGSKASLESNVNNEWQWQSVGLCDYSINNNTLTVKIERSKLGLTDLSDLNFEFKWSDNMQEQGNLMDFYVNGDVAPAGRFNYIYNPQKNDEGYLKSCMPLGINQGLKEEVFEGDFDTIPDFSSLKVSKTNYPLEINNVSDYPKFGSNFSGFIEAPLKESYKFTLSCDADTRLYIDNFLVTEYENGQLKSNNIIKLMPGMHQFRLEHTTKDTSKPLECFVESNSFSSTKLPGSVLYKYNIKPDASINFTQPQKYYSSIDSVFSVKIQDKDGTIAKVEMYDNNQLVKTDTSLPLNTYNFEVGNHKVQLKITDNDGGEVVTNQLSFIVEPAFEIPCQILPDKFCQSYSVSLINSTHPQGGVDIRAVYGWSDYYINAPENGSYKVTFTVPASVSGTKKISVKNKGDEIALVNVANVGNAQAWYDVTTTVNLTAGIHKLHLDFTGSIILHKISFDFTNALNTTSTLRSKISPNPSKGEFLLQTDENIALLVVTNLVGEELERYQGFNSNNFSFGQNLTSGVYMVRVIGESGKQKVLKIVKQ